MQIRALHENAQLIDARREPVAWNTNQALIEIAQRLDRIESEQRELERLIRQLSQLVQAR